MDSVKICLQIKLLLFIYVIIFALFLDLFR